MVTPYPELRLHNLTKHEDQSPRVILAGIHARLPALHPSGKCKPVPDRFVPESRIQECIHADAILGDWIAAFPAAMTKHTMPEFKFQT